MDRIKKLICIHVPVTQCNLSCNYCYITAKKLWKPEKTRFHYTVPHMIKCLSTKRLGGICLINLTGGGETLIPQEIVEIIKGLLEEGHYLEVVTNGTLTNRFEEIVKLPEKLLERLTFKFSFHYLELAERRMLNVFWNNVNLVREHGCSFTIELMPHDKINTVADLIKKECLDNAGALCQLTIARDDSKKTMAIQTADVEKYVNCWKTFDSPMFDFKLSLFGIRRTEFCCAGKWSMYVDMATGYTKSCYGQPVALNIFKNPDERIDIPPVGHFCTQPFCFNGHAHLALGLIPELDTPTYAEMRNRVGLDGRRWLSAKVNEVYSQKLYENNKIISRKQRVGYTLLFPFWAGIKIIEMRFKKKVDDQHGR